MHHKSNKQFNITKGLQESNPVLDKMFKNAEIGAPNNMTQSWDGVNDIYNAVAEGIVTTATEINDTVKIINQLGVSNDSELVLCARGLIRDIETFTSDMVKIKARHAGLTGLVKDGEELSLCLSIFNDYVILNDRFRAVTFPTVITVTEYLAEAVEVKRQRDAEAAALDVNVITDVEVKDCH